MACFNCGSTEGAATYSFDLDLPTIDGCKTCLFALSMGDEDLLDALKPQAPGRARRVRRRASPRRG